MDATEDRPLDRWDEIERLFRRALDLPPEEHAAFLGEACPRNAALRARVQALLSTHAAIGVGEAAAFLATPAAEFAAPLLADAELDRDAASPPAPAHVGPYRIVREAGRGGMGIVYLAERDDEQFRLRVALKLVPRGMELDSHALRRFREERQILAILDHPNIARLLDGGVTGDGLPWFAMEYVEGARIDRYCDEHRLSVDARLELFCTVCDAIQYAHRNLVVHRDLKPSNVLVTEDGRAKLLDFGIAKLLTTESAGYAALTRTGVRPLTPEYASPEQIRGEPISTASDVYSLGVLLYELLTGRSPYRRGDRTPHEIERRVLEAEPERPSTVVSYLAEGVDHARITPEQVSHARRTTPARLRRRLRGDLDSIVLMALRKEPALRYASAKQLMDDVRGHLDGRPVLARTGRFSYRAAKFVRRNRTAIGAGLAFITFGVGFTAFHVINVAGERDAARREAAKAEQVSAFLVDLFQESDPYRIGPDTRSVADFLEAGAQRLDRELLDQPDVRATMLSVIGRVYERLGRFDDALGLASSALEVRRQSLPRDRLGIARNLNDLGVLQYRKGNYAAAESLYMEALATRETREGQADAEIVEVLHNLAEVRTRQREYLAADSLHRRVLALRRELLGPAHPDLAISLTGLGVVARGQGEYAVAESYHREALAIRRAHYGDAHPSVGESLKNLALALHSQHRYNEAEQQYRQALAVQTRVLGEAHPELATTLNSLASLLRMKGDYGGAEPLYRQALAIHFRTRGRAHPATANAMDNLAILLWVKGDLDAAESLSRDALSIRREVLGPGHPSVATGSNTLGSILRDQGRFGEAEPLLREALAMYRAGLGPDHPFTAAPLSNLGALERYRREYAAAESLYRQALAVFDDDDPERPMEAAPALLGLGDVLLARDQPEAAEPLLRELLAMRRDRLPGGHWEIAEAAAALGHCLVELGRYAEAEPLLRESERALAASPGLEQDRARRRALEQLVALNDALGRGMEARRFRALLTGMGGRGVAPGAVRRPRG